MGRPFPCLEALFNCRFQAEKTRRLGAKKIHAAARTDSEMHAAWSAV
jgi:tRNA U38,U39,U40 pseudouridine synthase TruA